MTPGSVRGQRQRVISDRAVGEASRRAGIAREQLRVTSKLPGRHHHYKEALATIEESLYRAQLDSYDQYLIHWPNPSKDLYVEAWTALIEARKRGLVRSIGVCNFLPAHLERIIAETGVTPAVNQTELHPHFPQAEQRAFNAAHGLSLIHIRRCRRSPPCRSWSSPYP